MRALHKHLAKKYSRYDRWHNHPNHHHIHWLVFVLAFFIGVSGIVFSWRLNEQNPLSSVTLIRVSAQVAQIGEDGKTIEQRKQDWLNRDGRRVDGTYNGITHDGNSHIFAWMEKGLYFDDTSPPETWMGSASQEIQELFNEWNDAGSLAQITGMRLYLQYGDVLRGERPVNGKIYQNTTDFTDIENTMKNQVRQYSGLTARLGGAGQNCSSQPMRSITGYLYTLTDTAATFVYPSNVQSWTGTKSGTLYEPGKTYNSRVYALDLLNSGFKNCFTVGGNDEMDGGHYSWRPIISFLLLYDFADRVCQVDEFSNLCAEGREVKRQAKMTLDTILLGEMMDFSAKQHGGTIADRNNRRELLDSQLTYGLHYPMFGLPEKAIRDSHGNMFVSSYRPSPLIHKLSTNASSLGSSYWHWNTENYAMANMQNTGKWNFVNKYFNMGSADTVTPRWRLSVRSDQVGQDDWKDRAGQPFLLWIDQKDWTGHPCNDSFVSSCNKAWGLGEPTMRQFRNAAYIKMNNPRLHVVQDNDFDEGQDVLNSLKLSVQDPNCTNAGNAVTCENNYGLGSGWKFFREGKTAIALNKNGSSIGLEVAVIDPSCSEQFCYGSFEAFKVSVIDNASVTSNSFTTSRGVVISANDGALCGLNSPGDCVFPFKRFENTSSDGKLIEWLPNNQMKIQSGSESCLFDFNGWVYSGTPTNDAGCGILSTGPRDTSRSGGSVTAGIIAEPVFGDSPLRVQFTSVSMSSQDDPIQTHYWDFGTGGDVSSQENPEYTYNTDGNYTVTLTVTTAGGNSDTDTVIIRVGTPSNAPPRAVVSADPTFGEAPLTVRFTGSNSSDSDGNIVSYSWDFKDGNTSSTANPVHTFSQNGSYNVTLTVTDNDGAVGTSSVIVTVGSVGSANLNCSGVVDVQDFGIMLSWLNGSYPNTLAPESQPDGTYKHPDCPAGEDRSPDLNNDGSVNNVDLSIMLSQWGTGGAGSSNNPPGNGNTPPSSGTTPPSQSAGDYPLIGWQTFTGAVNDFYSRFNLLVYRDDNEQRVQELKQINPNMKVVWTFDWNAAVDINGIPSEWQLKDVNGNPITIYGTPGWPMMNMSKWGPRANGPYGNQTYREFVATHFERTADISVFDGWGTDGAWGRDNMKWAYNRTSDPDMSQVDANNNGINDHDEFTDEEWLDNWQAGMDELVANVRAKLDSAGSDKLLIINSGSTHRWSWQDTNGIIIEKQYAYFDDEFNRKYWNDFSLAGKKPLYSVADGLPDGQSPNLPANTKNDFRGMRFGLVTSMFNDVYYSFQSSEAGEHYWSYWYDEFDANLGKPVSGVQQVRAGLWVRFFDNGVAIASTNGQDQIVTDADLRSFSEYNGPYYRFQGGQNPSFNNGAQFDSVTLVGDLLGSVRRLGDGIILFNQPTTVVSDIIIDNVDMGTSPSNVSATLSGFSQVGCNSGAPGVSNYYTLRCGWNPGSYAYAESSVSGSVAEYTPNIGVAGTYNIYEWHGNRNTGGLSCNNVQVYVQGNASCNIDSTIDQTVNPGGWNKIGSCTFEKGSGSKIVLSSPGGCVAQADAIKFEYVPESNAQPTPTPTPQPTAQCPAPDERGGLVVLSGNNIPQGFLGKPVSSVYGYKYVSGTWQREPVQVDEVRQATSPIIGSVYVTPSSLTDRIPENDWAGTDTDIGIDNGEYSDEIVFAVSSLGDKAPASASNPDNISSTRYEVEWTDPVTNVTKYFYLFSTNQALTPISADAVSYDFNLSDCNGYLSTCEDTTVDTACYSTHFSLRWVQDEFRVKLAAGGDGSDMIDRIMGSAYATSATVPFRASVGENEDHKMNAKIACGGWSVYDPIHYYLGHIDGPVRAIRQIKGACSFENLVRIWKFSGDQVEEILSLQGHGFGPDSGGFGIRTNYSSQSAPLTYYSDSFPQGIVFDGIPDFGTTVNVGEMIPQDILGGIWGQISSSSGGALTYLKQLVPFADLNKSKLWTYIHDDSGFTDTTSGNGMYGGNGFRLTSFEDSEPRPILFKQITRPIPANTQNSGVKFKQMMDSEPTVIVR